MNKELRELKEIEEKVIQPITDDVVLNNKFNDENKLAMKIDKSNKILEMIDRRISMFQNKRDKIAIKKDKLEASLTQIKISKNIKS